MAVIQGEGIIPSTISVQLNQADLRALINPINWNTDLGVETGLKLAAALLELRDGGTAGQVDEQIRKDMQRFLSSDAA